MTDAPKVTDTDGTLGTPGVPRNQAADLRKGHQDTRDAPPGSPDLLAGLRTGDWLDQQTFPPLVYAIDGLIPEGLTLLVGPPKAGKSYLILGVLLARAKGGAALGKLRLGQARRVLYLALEDGDRRMQDRCRQLLGETPTPALYTYLTRVEPGAIVATIEAYLARYPDTALVVIDTLGKVMPQALPQETTYQRDYRVAGRLKAISDAHPGLALVALHHDRKAAADDFVERVSGSNGLAGAADTIIVLSRKRQSRDGVLAVTGRDVPEGEYALTMADDGMWTLDGADLAAAGATARKRSEQSDGLSDLSTDIITFVAGYGPDGTTRKEVVDKFGDHAGRYLTRHHEAGRLVRVARGRYAVPTPVPSVPVSFSQISAGNEEDTGCPECPVCGWPEDSAGHEKNCERMDDDWTDRP